MQTPKVGIDLSRDLVVVHFCIKELHTCESLSILHFLYRAGSRDLLMYFLTLSKPSLARGKKPRKTSKEPRAHKDFHNGIWEKR